MDVLIRFGGDVFAGLDAAAELGAVLTVAYAMATGTESVSPLKVLLILGIVGCVVGLKLLS